MVLADLVFPVGLEPYIATAFLPWAGAVALLAEMAVYAVWYGLSGRLTILVVGANVASSCVGVGLALTFRRRTRSPDRSNTLHGSWHSC